MDKSLFLTPYILSLLISLGVLIYTRRHRHVQGANAYSWYVLGQSIWIFGYILELVTPSLKGKIFWDQIQWFAGFFILISFPVFALRYTETRVSRPRLLFGLSLIVPLLFCIMLLTDAQHHLLYPNPYLDHSVLFSDLKYDFTWVVYTYAIYSYLVSLSGIAILIRRLFRPHLLYKRQIITVAIGFITPIFFTMLTTAGVKFAPFRDVSPFTFAIGNLIVAWGLFRYHLFDIIPIARDIVLENILDIVFVLDAQDRVVDANTAALFALNQKPAQVIGRHAEDVFGKWPELIDRFKETGNISSEVSIEAFGNTFCYEVKSTVLEDKRQRYLGRVFVARDVTERAELQTNLQKLNDDLEARVANRTAALRQIAERYRAVVENQTEFIVRWKPDRTRTFVNEAYCRYFGLTYEEAMTVDFMTLIVEEDRQMVQEKISRLEAGEANSATEIHRVIKPDGSVGWNEWIDIAIRDANGEITEFQSVGRDITERVQAEETLQLQSAALEAAANSIVITDRDGIIQWANPAFTRLTGYTTEEAIGKNPRDLVWSGKQDRSFYKKLWDTILAGRVWHGELINRRKDGTLYTEEMTLTPVRDKSGQVIRFIAIKQDISERKQTELALRESEEKHRLLFESANDSIFIMKGDRFIDCNSRALEMFNCQRNQIIGKSPLDFSPERQPDGQSSEKKTREKIEAVLKEKSQFFEWKHCRLDKTQFDAEVSLNLLEMDGEIFIQSIVRDITERKRAERNLIEAYDITLEGWAKALELRDKETEDHSRRVTELTVKLAQAMGLHGEAVVHIRRGAILHDIGKMAIPDEILRKRGPLTDAERRVIEQHPLRSYELLSPISFLEKALEIPYCHHEHWDGGGYPRGLKGDEIPLAARIFTVIDVWDAVQSERPYNRAWPKEKAIQYLKDESGKYFDPECVSVFLAMVEQGKI